MEKADAAELVALLSMAFPRPPMQEGTMQVYESMMLDLPRETAQAAVQRLITSSRFLPTIAEIRAAAVEVVRGPKRAGAEAWGDVTMAIRRVGRYRPPPDFDDPLVSECVTNMGWLSLCDSTNETADRARFIELYDQIAARDRVDRQVSGLLSAPSVSLRLLK